MARQAGQGRNRGKGDFRDRATKLDYFTYLQPMVQSKRQPPGESPPPSRVRRVLRLGAIVAFLAVLGGGAYWYMTRTAALDDVQIATAYAAPLPPPDGPLDVFHLGHSLVGRDMPEMLFQLAQAGHHYTSQLGWGTPLKSHWEPDVPINGFETENDHPRYRDATEALQSGDYDAVILTEMVEIRDAIEYHDSDRYLAKWAALAREHNPDVRVYLYETWPSTDDPEGWLLRLERDLPRYWEDAILLRAMARDPEHRPIHVIPAGQVFAQFIRAVDEVGGVDNITGPRGLFAIDANGDPDPIHLNDIGAYLVALTHYAVLYHASPVGLPHRLMRADGTPADAPGEATARLMQETVWQVVTNYPKTGVAQP